MKSPKAVEVTVKCEEGRATLIGRLPIFTNYSEPYLPSESVVYKGVTYSRRGAKGTILNEIQ